MVTKLTLKKATNNTGIAYSQVQFSLVDKLTLEQTDVMKAYSDSLRCVTRNIDFTDDTVNVNEETGEIIEPLND